MGGVPQQTAKHRGPMGRERAWGTRGGGPGSAIAGRDLPGATRGTVRPRGRALVATTGRSSAGCGRRRAGETRADDGAHNQRLVHRRRVDAARLRRQRALDPHRYLRRVARDRDGRRRRATSWASTPLTGSTSSPPSAPVCSPSSPAPRSIPPRCVRTSSAALTIGFVSFLAAVPGGVGLRLPGSMAGPTRGRSSAASRSRPPRSRSSTR